MQPRLSTSRKWSPLPEELVKQIRSVFRQNFASHVGTGTVEVHGRIYPEEILVSVGVKSAGALKQSNWEISIQYKQPKDNVLKLFHTAIDAMAALFEQLFSAEDDQDFPRKWEEVDFEGRKIYVQYSTENSALEAEANKLLGIDEDDTRVAQGDWDEDISPDVIKRQLGVDDDEDSDSDSDSDDVGGGGSGKKRGTH